MRRNVSQCDGVRGDEGRVKQGVALAGHPYKSLCSDLPHSHHHHHHHHPHSSPGHQTTGASSSPPASSRPSSLPLSQVAMAMSLQCHHHHHHTPHPPPPLPILFPPPPPPPPPPQWLPEGRWVHSPTSPQMPQSREDMEPQALCAGSVVQ